MFPNERFFLTWSMKLAGHFLSYFCVHSAFILRLDVVLIFLGPFLLRLFFLHGPLPMIFTSKMVLKILVLELIAILF